MMRPLLLACMAFHSGALMINDGVVRSTAAARSAPAIMAKKSATKKLVSVVLDADVDGLGEKGSLVEVKPAYAENFLVAQSLGSIATKEMLERIAAEVAEAAAAEAAAKAKAEATKEAVKAKYGSSGMTIEAQVGDGSLLKEPITSADVSEMLKRAASVTVEPEAIMLPDMTELGSEIAELKLHPSVRMSLKVDVIKSKITFS